MPTPFDHLSQFQSLDADTKAHVLSKFNTLSPDDKQKVMGKINTPMANRGLDEGVQPVMAPGIEETIPDLTKKEGGLFQQGGEILAGKMMTKGMVNANIDPYLAATVGTTIAMIPHVAAALTGGPKATKAATEVAEEAIPAAKTLGTALTPGGKAKLGMAIGAAEKQAGVEQAIPTVSNMAKRLDLPARERGFADIVNKVKQTLDNGEQIAPQDLSDFRDLVKQQYGAGKIAKGTRMDALTAQTNKAAGSKLNELIPNRAEPAAEYSRVASVQNALKTLAKAGAGASGLGLSGLILKKLAGH